MKEKIIKKRQDILRIILTASSICLLLTCLALITFDIIHNHVDAFGVTPSKAFHYKLEPCQIIIPKIKLQEKVYDDPTPGAVGNEFLNKGPAYYDENTNKPGQGNCVIAGHSAVTKEHGAPFARVNEKELKKGDEIFLTDQKGKITKYIISEIKIVASTDFSVIQVEEKPTVTLITCIAPDYPRDKRLIIKGVIWP